MGHELGQDSPVQMLRLGSQGAPSLLRLTVCLEDLGHCVCVCGGGCHSDLHRLQHLTQRKTLEHHLGTQNSGTCCLSYKINTGSLLIAFRCSTTKHLLEQAPGTAPARWLSGEEPACQCRRLRRLGFDRWVGKIPWGRIWQPTPVFLPGESHGQRSLWATVHGVAKCQT